MHPPEIVEYEVERHHRRVTIPDRVGIILSAAIVVGFYVAFALLMDTAPSAIPRDSFWQRARSYALIAVCIVAGAIILRATGCELGPTDDYFGPP
jgi:hypothetical protein